MEEYDEFGNYVGGARESSDSSEEVEEPQQWPEPTAPAPESPVGIITSDDILIDDPGHDVVLYEDKRYYPEAAEVYPEAETLIMEEDAQPITEPIIAPVKVRTFEKVEKEPVNTTFDKEFLCSLSQTQSLVRNIGFFGHLHHGKTSLIDLLVEQTHPDAVNDPKQKLRYTDTREDERIREISVKCKPLSLVLMDSREKSYLMNVMDTPGHPNFYDEVVSGMRVCDGVFLVVDVIEGMTMGTQKILHMAVSEGLPIFLLLNKIDRLILELKLPPGDAYYKLKLTLDQVNLALSTLDPTRSVSPTSGTVLFSSGLYGFIFSLHSFAQTYTRLYASDLDPTEFAKRLWGDAYFDPSTHRFRKTPPEGKSVTDRSFVEFVLMPLYKLMGYTVSEEKEALDPILAAAGVYIKKQCYTINTQSLLKVVCQTFFKQSACIVDTAIKLVEDPGKATKRKMERYYSGALNGELPLKLQSAAISGPLLIDLVKFYHRPDCEHFDAFGRVLSGTVRKGQVVQVFGDRYSRANPEDMSQQKVANLWVFNSRYRMEVDSAVAGSWVLIGGIEANITKSGTVSTPDLIPALDPLVPIRYGTESIVKIALEPYNPSELPKMLDGLRKCNMSYGLLKTKVEESGEHIILGTGELMLDSVLHDLRRLYGELEIKLSDPFVAFNETVIDTSSFKPWADTPNSQNRICVLSEPLDKQVALDIESASISLSWPAKTVSRHFQSKYGWDALAARNIWAFGPTTTGPNVLLNDCLPGDADFSLLAQAKPHIVQGFQWACKEGPLCDEPMRNTKFRVIEAKLAREGVFRASGQVIPTARRVCYSAFLLATPRLMEPFYTVEMQCTQDCMPAILTLLQRRRGHVQSEEAVPGAPFYRVMATIPVIDSFGFETDLRTCTSGTAFGLPFFSHWDLVPGDPLDRSITLRPLEPVPAPHLSREFMLKTRRRKGLVEDVSVAKFFDDEALLALARQDQDLAPYLL